MKERYHILDIIRAISIISMVIYHALWDAVYMFGFEIPLFRTYGAYAWQQSICITFILLSGFCAAIGKRSFKNALVLLSLGALISAATYVFAPPPIICGVLTLLGAAALLTALLRGVLEKVNAALALFVSSALFVLLKDAPQRAAVFGLFRLPEVLYQNMFTAHLGFAPKGFYSSDYFPLVPWLFLFWAGFFLCRVMRERGAMAYLSHGKGKEWRPLRFLGRHSLVIYMLHQPILIAAFAICRRF